MTHDLKLLGALADALGVSIFFDDWDRKARINGKRTVDLELLQLEFKIASVQVLVHKNASAALLCGPGNLGIVATADVGAKGNKPLTVRLTVFDMANTEPVHRIWLSNAPRSALGAHRAVEGAAVLTAHREADGDFKPGLTC